MPLSEGSLDTGQQQKARRVRHTCIDKSHSEWTGHIANLIVVLDQGKGCATCDEHVPRTAWQSGGRPMVTAGP